MMEIMCFWIPLCQFYLHQRFRSYWMIHHLHTTLLLPDDGSLSMIPNVDANKIDTVDSRKTQHNFAVDSKNLISTIFVSPINVWREGTNGFPINQLFYRAFGGIDLRKKSSGFQFECIWWPIVYL